LGDVTKAANWWHEHGIDIYLLKDGGRNGNDGWNANLHHLAELALVASADVPFDILLKGRPPKPVEECAACEVETFVTKAVISIVDEGEMKKGVGIKLVTALVLMMPKLAICKEELLCLSEQVNMGTVVKVAGLLKCREVLPNEVNFIVRLASLIVDGRGVVGISIIAVERGKLVGIVGDNRKVNAEGPDYNMVVSMRGQGPAYNPES
jgi:hypothetical protein